MLYEVSNVVGEDTGMALPSPLTIDESRYSTLRKLLRVTVYCFKFIYAKVIIRCSTVTVERNFGKNTVMGNMFHNVKLGSILL